MCVVGGDADCRQSEACAKKELEKKAAEDAKKP
jgi:hypothetical protein